MSLPPGKARASDVRVDRASPYCEALHRPLANDGMCRTRLRTGTATGGRRLKWPERRDECYAGVCARSSLRDAGRAPLLQAWREETHDPATGGLQMAPLFESEVRETAHMR